MTLSARPLTPPAVTQCPDLTFNQSHHAHREHNKIQPAQISQGGRTVGSKVVFTCPRGFGLGGGQHELLCLPTGHWSGPLPYCQGE